MQPQQPGDGYYPHTTIPSRWPIYAGTLIPALWFPFIGWAVGILLTIIQVNVAKKQNLSPQPYWEAFAIAFLITLLMTIVWMVFHK